MLGDGRKDHEFSHTQSRDEHTLRFHPIRPLDPTSVGLYANYTQKEFEHVVSSTKLPPRVLLKK
jgi:hypothetical protein